MTSTHRRLRSALTSALSCLLVALGFATNSADAANRRLDLQPRRMAAVPAGTVVINQPPQGWTHLILKNHPVLSQAEANKIHSIAADIADMFFGTVLARVDSAETAGGRVYWIRQVAVGLGTSVNGRDTVIDSTNQARLGANLGIIGRTVLSRTEEELARWHVVARSDNLVVLDMPTRLAIGGRHYQCVIRLFISVEPTTGQLATLFTAQQDTSSGRQYIGNTARWLPQNLVNNYTLVVDANEVLAGIPNSAAFAMASLPAGTSLGNVDSIVPILTQRRYTSESFTQLESVIFSAARGTPAPAAQEARQTRRAPLAQTAPHPLQ